MELWIRYSNDKYYYIASRWKCLNVAPGATSLEEGYPRELSSPQRDLTHCYRVIYIRTRTVIRYSERASEVLSLGNCRRRSSIFFSARGKTRDSQPTLRAKVSLSLSAVTESPVTIKSQVPLDHDGSPALSRFRLCRFALEIPSRVSSARRFPGGSRVSRSFASRSFAAKSIPLKPRPSDARCSTTRTNAGATRNNYNYHRSRAINVTFDHVASSTVASFTDDIDETDRRTIRQKSGGPNGPLSGAILRNRIAGIISRHRWRCTRSSGFAESSGLIAGCQQSSGEGGGTERAINSSRNPRSLARRR